jgi:predicted SAM-dependent methyltransferase
LEEKRGTQLARSPEHTTVVVRETGGEHHMSITAAVAGRLARQTRRLVRRSPLLSRWDRVSGHLGRELIANTYLQGEGIEIGALHHPLPVPATARVHYVDRTPVSELRRQYPELAGQNLVTVDIVDDGESLGAIAAGSQAFVIANHFLEHCQNPIGAIRNMLRVLSPGGILYLAVPDKRYTFDRDRPVTPLEHLLRDESEGPAWSRRQHFEEWVRLVNKVEDALEAEKKIAALLEMDYSIHYHVWTQTEFLTLILDLQQRREPAFEIELFLKLEHEILLVLRKSS